MTWDRIFGIASTLAAIVIVGGGIAGLWLAWQWAVAWWDAFLDDSLDEPQHWLDTRP